MLQTRLDRKRLCSPVLDHTRDVILLAAGTALERVWALALCRIAPSGQRASTGPILDAAPSPSAACPPRTGVSPPARDLPPRPAKEAAMTNMKNTLSRDVDPITLPTTRISPGDLMDRALDKLRTVHLALAPDNTGWHDNDVLAAVWATLDQVICELEPIRNRLQGVDAPRSSPRAVS